MMRLKGDDDDAEANAPKAAAPEVLCRYLNRRGPWGSEGSEVAFVGQMMLFILALVHGM